MVLDVLKYSMWNSSWHESVEEKNIVDGAVTQCFTQTLHLFLWGMSSNPGMARPPADVLFERTCAFLRVKAEGLFKVGSAL